MSSLKDFYKKFHIDPKAYLDSNIMGDYAYIPVSPQIDLSCGGGIREGSLVIISGHEKLGKSTFALQAAANAQNLEDGKERKIFYLDVENRINSRDLAGIHNLNFNNKNFEVIGSSASGPIPAETYFNLAENIVTTTPHSLIIFDSFSMLLTRAELSYNFEDNKMRPDVPAYASIFCKKMCQLLRPSKSILFGINHVYTAQNYKGPGTPPLQESGGKKMQYIGNYKFRLVSKSPVEQDGKVIGNTVSFQCLFHPSHQGANPHDKMEFFHRFGYGIDAINDYIDLGVLYGAVKQSGSWYSYGELKGQGKERFRSKLIEEKKGLKNLIEEVKKCL